MASSTVRSAAQQLAKLLVEEVKFLYGVEDKVEELQVELSWMQVFLRDADKKQHQDELIHMWVSQIQDLAYEAEDIVEKYVHRVSRRGRDKLWNSLPKKLPCVLYNASALHEVGSDIDKLTLKISKLNKRLKSYGVTIEKVDDSHYITRIRDMRRTYSNTVDKDLIKREGDIKKLVGLLLDPKAESNVVGIVGMGGLGKTTLAREVYRDKAVVDGFTHLVWIYVSPHPQRRSILEDTLRQLGGDSELSKSTGDDRLSEDVRRRLTTYTCLVVLDDIWNKDTRFLKQIFANTKAKILLTTRYVDQVGNMDPKAFILRPTLLNEDDGWELLYKKALIEKDYWASPQNSKLEELGKTMLKHCKGLPIAIVALGGILATKPRTAKGWEEVGNNITSYLARHTDQQDDDMGVEEVLELSYNELPLYLKPCFLYLGNFPEKSEIPTSTLNQLWEAEGLIQAPARRNEARGKGVRTYDIAEQYLEELVKRCMVEVSELYENGAIKTCRLHDIMRDLCLKKSEEARFLQVVTTDDPEMSSHEYSSRQVWTTHRVAIRVRDKKSADSFFNSRQENAMQLRSLIIDLPQDNDQLIKFGLWFSKMCKAFGLLRVLRLEGGKINKLPDEIGSCIHLRYLSFRLAHESEVPRVVWKLNYLQTLDLQHNDEGLRVPDKLVKLKRLAHLYLPEAYKATGKLRFSQPRQVKTLVNVDLKDLHGDDLANMTNLRMFSFKKDGPMDGESLGLVFGSNIITSSLVENPISTLCIDAESINHNPQILSSSTDVWIEILTIKGMIKPSLGSIVFPRTVVSLELYGSSVQGDRIADLVIHGLKELHLKENAIRGRKLVVSCQSFPQLKKLTLELARNSELSEVEGTLPSRCLFSIRCPRNLEAKISFALQQLRHNRDFLRINFTDDNSTGQASELPAQQGETADSKGCIDHLCGVTMFNCSKCLY